MRCDCSASLAWGSRREVAADERSSGDVADRRRDDGDAVDDAADVADLLMAAGRSAARGRWSAARLGKTAGESSAVSTLRAASSGEADDIDPLARE